MEQKLNKLMGHSLCTAFFEVEYLALKRMKSKQSQRHICSFYTETSLLICTFVFSLLLFLGTFAYFYCDAYLPADQLQIPEAKIITQAKHSLLAKFSLAESIFFFFYHHSKISVTTKRSLFSISFSA